MNRRRFLTSSAAFAALSGIPACQKSGRTQTLTIFTWADYLKRQIKEAFEKQNNCRIVIDTFESNEAMFAKLNGAPSSYDLLVPSSYAVTALNRRGLLQPLDHSQLPNIKNLDPAYLSKAADPKMAFSVPYLATPTCLGYLASKVADPKQSWAMLGREDLKGRITLLNDMREVMGAALKLLGHSLNSTDPAQLAAAADVAIGWKRNAAKFANEQYKSGITSGELFLVQGYAGDLLQAADENEDVRFFIPEEGTGYSCDDFCIPKGAGNVALAHRFIDFLCKPEVAAENMEFLGYRAPNSAAYSHLTEDFRGSEVLFPPDEIFAKCEPVGDLGDKLPLWVKEWERVKGS